MTINDFATQHRLKTKHDKGDDTTIIPGKSGQLYEYSDEEFAVMYFLPVTKPARPRVWNRMRDLCAAAGMVLRQNGDAEGALSFNPENREQVKHISAFVLTACTFRPCCPRDDALALP